MNDWNEGYFTDTAYTYGYFRDVSPVFQNFCLLLKGIAPPPPANASGAAHCELAYGQGVSINVHAAATPGKFFGTDFTPAHAAHANELLAASGSDAEFYEYSFEEMLHVPNLPQFDSISLHGIWSWVTPENREHIIEFARRYLKPGGVFYVSYNSYPGWAAHSPLRELFALYDTFARKSSNTTRRVEDAINFTEELLNANPLYATMVPDVRKKFEDTRKLDHNYLAHEYFNREWDLMYFVDVAEQLQAAKLEFVGSTDPIESVENLSLIGSARSFLAKIENPLMREQIRDYFINRQFRKDLYVRGKRTLPPQQQAMALLSTRYVLLTTNEIGTKFMTPAGEATLKEHIHKHLMEYMKADNYNPKNLLGFTKAHPEIPAQDIVIALVCMIEAGMAMPCQSGEAAETVRPNCRALNDYLCESAKWSDKIGLLASPVTGCGVGADRSERLFLHFMRQGQHKADELARSTWSVLSTQGYKLGQEKGGEKKTLQTDAENIAALTELAESFFAKRLPILKALQIVQ